MLRVRATEMLLGERGTELRGRRGHDVETVFGDIKRNLGFTRFLLRGIEKASHETRLVDASHRTPTKRDGSGVDGRTG